MAVSKQYLDYLLEQLGGLGGVEARRMFGGAGLYSRGTFFGLLYRDRLYFKTDDTTRSEYEARGCEGFRPRPGVNAQMTYYTVPAEVLEDQDELVQWAQNAVTAALTTEAGKRAADQTSSRAPTQTSGSRRSKRARQVPAAKAPGRPGKPR